MTPGYQPPTTGSRRTSRARFTCGWCYATAAAAWTLRSSGWRSRLDAEARGRPHFARRVAVKSPPRHLDVTARGYCPPVMTGTRTTERRVLVVEDEPDLTELLTFNLQAG